VSPRGARFLCELCVLCDLCVKSFCLTSSGSWVRFHFIDLLGVPLAVRRDEQNKLISIQLAQRAVVT